MAVAKKSETTPLEKRKAAAVKSQPWWQPYWELSRMPHWPRGTMLMFWPCVWGYILGRHGQPEDPVILLQYATAFLVGNTILHCTICTLNDICDIDLDRQVERTKNRPLPSGRLSIFQAWVFLSLQLAVFFAMLSVVNKEAFICGAFGVLPLHALYPLMKRWTNWPQAWLGLTMGWGVPTAWLMSSPHDYGSPAMWVLTLGIPCWAIVYDTIYACQDRKDDIKAGVKSCAVLFGSWVKQILALFAAAFVGSLIYAGVESGQGWLYYLVAAGGCAAHFAWQLITLDPDDGKDCEYKFDSNGQLGYLVTAGLLVQWYLK
ncbi:UbiA prenyltransferase [Neolentinus lepideus HHB14362 ss-1]|uniref:4-hydroxybenzoate polyprenyltransferase, mitochondrial n=1 Tax=Neolentinus lepideus HHB14362 ss-1 TaxID=1314782 RepID=A0A165R236_9AGAM|nr:UbiA prenyltransferase [Neolentinus lepideus HHB14362 ss-1]